jgi:hypothetical protein
MFNTYYKFNYAGNKMISTGTFRYKEHKLTFNCKNNQRYIVNVEEYDYYTFIIKFHLKSHSPSKNKYSLLTENYDAPAVIRTCIQIMLFFYKKNPYASFGFIGANGTDEVEKNNTKRYKLYKRIIENFFSPVNFYHYRYTEKSAYLLLNKDYQEESLKEKVEALFSNHYNF